MTTRNKRAAALGIALSFRLVLPLADGAVGEEDRAHTAYSYFDLDEVEVVVSETNLEGSYVASFSLTGSNVASRSLSGSNVATFNLTGSVGGD